VNYYLQKKNQQNNTTEKITEEQAIYARALPNQQLYVLASDHGSHNMHIKTNQSLY